MDRDVRMQWLRAHNVQATLMFPSTGVGVEYELRDFGPETVFANIRAFNKWLAEDWGWNYQETIISSAMLSLVDIDMAVAELERVLIDRTSTRWNYRPSCAARMQSLHCKTKTL